MAIKESVQTKWYWRGSIEGTQFGSENAIKIMQTTGKYLAIMYESTACRFMTKQPDSIHCHVWVGWKWFSEHRRYVMVVVAPRVPDESEVADQADSFLRWDLDEPVGSNMR